MPNEITQDVVAPDSAALAVEEVRKSMAAALSDAHVKLADIAATATQAVAAKTAISDAQAVIATKSDHIQKAQEHADSVRANLDRALTAATQQVTESEAQKGQTVATAAAAAEQLNQIKAAKIAIDADALAIAKAKTSSESSAHSMKGLADNAAGIEEKVKAYEATLTNLESQCNIQLKAIVSLLPGATSAGLAHSFDERRQTFLGPRQRWEYWFIGSVIALVLLAITSLWQVFQTPNMTLEGLLLLWLSRLPLAGALVWLALHASHESALAKRLEEDYGYKSAIAASFLGFHRQMTDLGASAESNAPLAKLCADTLATIANPPGRIYDKHKLTVSPSSQVTEIAKAAAAQAAEKPAKLLTAAVAGEKR